MTDPTNDVVEEEFGLEETMGDFTVGDETELSEPTDEYTEEHDEEYYGDEDDEDEDDLEEDEEGGDGLGEARRRRRTVSGRYFRRTGTFPLEVRVDVDGRRPLKRLSGDFYQVSGRTTKYLGSFIVNSPRITWTATRVTIRGLGRFTFSAGAPVVQVTIQRRPVGRRRAPAEVQFFRTSGAPGATYICPFRSIYFRTVRIETDRVSDVTTPVFRSYNTSSLPSGGPARNLSVVRAYREAGIRMIPTSGGNVINISEAGANAKWSNAELHASMKRHFTLWKDRPQWSVWLLAAQLHEIGSGLYGIMFDQAGKQRQGCAVFHAGIGGTSAEKKRLQLYTYVHELGHCFNLLHSWQKSYASPPAPNRPKSLSWMNYPWYFPDGGPSVFWRRFPFHFDNPEVIHLRHAFRNNIVMGGNPFTVGSALGREVMPDPDCDKSGLTLSLSTHKDAFSLGEPVVLELTLGTTDVGGRSVHTWLHPNFGMVNVVINKPNGELVAYEPLIDHLVGERLGTIDKEHPAKESAYIGFGRDGFYFDQPGYYRVRAAYAALDGSEVLSDIITIRVRHPVTRDDDKLADLFMGEDQGTLLYLLGSDDDSLRNGNQAFHEVLEDYPDNYMANYARLIMGVNASRNFKTLTEDGQRVAVRAAHLDESASLLSAAADSAVLDAETKKMVYSSLADVQKRAGNADAEQDALNKRNAIT